MAAKGGQFYTDSHFVLSALASPRRSVRQLIREMSHLQRYHSARPRSGAVSLGRVMAIWSGTSVRLRSSGGHRDAGETETMMLSVAVHIRQAYVRRSKPGLSGSRQERIMGASQSAQNGRSLVALPWKNEEAERLSMTLPFDKAGAQNSLSHRWLPVGALITQHDVSDRDSLVNIAHSQRFRAAAIRATTGSSNFKSV